MTRLTIVVILSTLAATACSLGTVGVEQTTPPSPTPEGTTRTPQAQPTEAKVETKQRNSEGRCGDGVCDGPEDAQICPEDCAESTGEAQPTVDPDSVSSRPAAEPGTYWVTNPTSGVELYTTVMQPDDWDGDPLPTLVIIPGGDDPSSAITEGDISRMAIERGFVVIVFDPDGRGRSGGQESYNGFTHQDGLAAVIQFAAGLPEVDANRMGLMSFSFGVTLASGALARYPELPIRFFIDWEGPADRRDTTVGCRPSAHYDWPPCHDDAAWAEREALTFISQIQVPYQRVQMANDHVQSDVSHAVHMVNAAVEGPAPWVRLNDYPPNETYDADDPPEMFPNRSETSLNERMLDYAEEMFDVSGAPLDSSSDAAITPVYVTVAPHVEERYPEEAHDQHLDEGGRYDEAHSLGNHLAGHHTVRLWLG
jgi:pimeloyl-ACP methyl ester carboxylesterase